jgi:hypothetical protein
MKRKKNDLESLFDQMSVSASNILFRGIMLFPFAAIGGFWATIKLFMPFLRDITGVHYDELTAFGIGLVLSSIIYFCIVGVIYETSLEAHQKKIAKHILRELEKAGRPKELTEPNEYYEYRRKKYIRDIKKMSEGRKIVNK